MNRTPAALLALAAALGMARLLPEHGFGLGVRLFAATAVLLVPGALVARALRIGGVAAALVWTLGLLVGALAITFAVHGSLWLTLGLLGAAAAAALPFALKRWAVRPAFASALAILLGFAIGLAVWHVAGFNGDAFFHLGRIRKLEVFDDLSLRAVDEFRDGGLHPGYAFPLWHAFVALVARVAGVDPAAVVLHEPTVLVPLSFALFYEAGATVFRSAWAGLATVLAQAALIGLAPGHGGAYPTLALPGTAARQLIVPATLVLFFAFVRERSKPLLASTAAAALALVLVHPTYAVFLFVPLVGYLVARAILSRGEVVPAGTALAALGLPTLGVLLWLRPIVEETASHDPSREELRRALARYAAQLDGSEGSYHLAPEVFARGGAVAVGALLLVPVAALAARRRWAAFVLGGSLAVFVVTLLPFVFPTFADVVSLSQARRLAGFLPFAFAFAGGALALSGVLRLALPPLALAAGIALQLIYPGDFGFRLEHGGPALATWIAVFGGLGALMLGTFLVRREPRERGTVAALATGLFVLPVAIHGFSNWSALDPARPELSSGLVQALRDDVGQGDVVFSDPETSYQAAAFAPVYVAVAPPTHVADTEVNRPYERERDARAFFGGRRDLELPRGYGAEWIVVDRRRSKLRLRLPRVFEDERYALYRL